MTFEAPASNRPGNLDDYALVRRMAERRVDGMFELWSRYAPILLGVARGILGAGTAAEEALHEGLLRAWAHAERYDPGRSSVSTWLVLTVRSCALERRRAGAKASEEAALELPARPSLPAALVNRQRLVRAALNGLEPVDREVVELAFWEGLSPAEIARRTAVDVATVRERALGAMKGLRQTLRDELREMM